MCVMYVYGPQPGRKEAEKEVFRDVLERIGGTKGDGVYCERLHCTFWSCGTRRRESIGIYGWGARNRECRAMVELVARNVLAVASSFFHNRERSNTSVESTRKKFGFRKQQLWKIKDCKAVVGEHVTTQHKPLVFVVCIQKKKQTKTVGLRTY